MQRQHGNFLSEWSAIYERFDVPADIGLAQAMVESGFAPRIISRGARAHGFCQWLPVNWSNLQQRSPYVIERYNHTTQAAYCAAHLTVLATMYGSFIPALSAHHAGKANVGRVIVNGARLGEDDSRMQYLAGSDFAQKLHSMGDRYKELYRSYGSNSARYAEMVFGAMHNVRHLRERVRQVPIFAMRVPHDIPIARVVERTGLSEDEVKHYNPALVRQVPATAALYLPVYMEEFGPDISFWHSPAPSAYAAVLDDFTGLDLTVDEWHDAKFESTLRDFQQRFRETETEEGTVMATVMGHIIGEITTGELQRRIEEFRSATRSLGLFEEAANQLGR